FASPEKPTSVSAQNANAPSISSSSPTAFLAAPVSPVLQPSSGGVRRLSAISPAGFTISVSFETTLIPINANRDNGVTNGDGTPWKKIPINGTLVPQPGIPVIRDFAYQQPLTQPDLELKKVS